MGIKKKINYEKVESTLLKQVDSFFEYHTEDKDNTLIILTHDKKTDEAALLIAGQNKVLTELILRMLQNTDYSYSVNQALKKYFSNRVEECIKYIHKTL